MPEDLLGLLQQADVAKVDIVQDVNPERRVAERGGHQRDKIKLGLNRLRLEPLLHEGLVQARLRDQTLDIHALPPGAPAGDAGKGEHAAPGGAELFRNRDC